MNMCSSEFDMICRIHRLEDKLLRSKNYQEQMEIQSALSSLRINLQKMRWKKQSNGLA